MPVTPEQVLHRSLLLCDSDGPGPGCCSACLPCTLMFVRDEPVPLAGTHLVHSTADGLSLRRPLCLESEGLLLPNFVFWG